MYQTEQEKFWATEFGNQYVSRNQPKEKKDVASNINFFAKILSKTNDVQTIIEYGSNIGLNLIAIQSLLPNCELSGLELNDKAFEELSKIPNVTGIHGSLLEYKNDKQYDLSFTKGVLIHINPDMLNKAYELLYQSSKKYILIAEYYNPTPVSIPYRGHNDRLFKRDFAGDMLEKYNDLTLVDYGFSYKRDNNFPQDDITWFLLKK